MRDSLFFSSIRSFCVAFFGIVGLLSALILTFSLLGIFSDSSPSDVPTKESVFTPQLFINAKNVKNKFSSEAPLILKLNIIGVIGENDLDMESFRTQLSESTIGIFKTTPVKAILLYIQSPGGTVIDATAIYHDLKSYKEQFQVPVYAYVDGLCASGGMYIAAAADKIYASNSSLIGSIGVISPPIFNFSKTMEKIGVEALTLSAGIGKDDLNSFRPWNKNEGENYKKIIETYYNQFVNIVTSNRERLSKAKLIEEYGANVFIAKEAEEKGYIDKADISLDEMLVELKEAAGIKEDTYQIVELEKTNWLKTLFGSPFSSSVSLLQKAFLKNNIRQVLNSGFEAGLDLKDNLSDKTASQFLYLYRPGE